MKQLHLSVIYLLKKWCSSSLQWAAVSKLIQQYCTLSQCNLNNVGLQHWNRFSALMFSCKFAAYFQNTFHKNTFGGLLLWCIDTTGCYHNDLLYSVTTRHLGVSIRKMRQLRCAGNSRQNARTYWPQIFTRCQHELEDS